MSDRAFDRYGRILGSSGYGYVIERIGKGFQPEEIVDSILHSHPQLDRSEVQSYVSEGLQAKISTDALNMFLASQSQTGRIEPGSLINPNVDWHDFVITNPRLFGVAPEGDRYGFTFEFGQTEGLPLIRITVPSDHWLEYFDAYRLAYEKAVLICEKYPKKFGLDNPADCEFLFAKAYAPERRW